MKLLQFRASWCGPCKVQTKEFEENPVNVPVEVISIDDEDGYELAEKNNVRHIPTMILLDDNGEVLQRWTGVTKSETINEFINGRQTAVTGDTPDAGESV